LKDPERKRVRKWHKHEERTLAGAWQAKRIAVARK
jgi:hypothetical protein